MTNSSASSEIQTQLFLKFAKESYAVRKIDYSDCPAEDQWAQIKSKRTHEEASAVIKRIPTTVPKPEC